jgi:hypothetical protein
MLLPSDGPASSKYLFLWIELKVDPACAASTPVDGSSAYAYRFEGVHQFRFTQPNLDF